MYRAGLRFPFVLMAGVFPLCFSANAMEEVIHIPKEIVQSPFAQEMEIALEAAKEAGNLLLSLRQKVVDRTAKEGHVADCTDADILSNELIYDKLHKAFPKDGYFSQEWVPGKGPSFENANRNWVVDPLDGTTPFAEGKVTGFCVIITLVDENKVPVLNVTHFPSYPSVETTTTFFAVKGYGAFKQEGENASQKLKSKKAASTIIAYSSTLAPMITKIYSKLGVSKENLVNSVSCGQRIAFLADPDSEVNLYLTSCLPTMCGKTLNKDRISFTKTWDIGGIVILEELGGMIKLVDPRDQIDWLNPAGVIYPQDGRQNLLVATSDPIIFGTVSKVLE